jgi:radical SAM enzyme (TIGR01210 family)
MRTTEPNDLTALVRRMSTVARRFRQTHPLNELDDESGVYYLPTGTQGSSHFKPLVWFPSRGCVWSLSGGCTMCNFGMTSRQLDMDEVLAQWDQLLERLGEGIQRLHIGPGGSFFTDAEVPAAVRVAVIRRLARLPFLRAVGMETRAPFVTEQKLEEVVSALPPSVERLTLGFGLECVSDLPRLVCINKGYGPTEILRTLDIMRTVESRHAGLTIAFEAYVMLKPIFMSEQEAIGEALQTIDWVLRHGGETAVLFLNTVKENTLQAVLAGPLEKPSSICYRPPFLRSAIEVLLQLPDEWREKTVVLGPQSAMPAHQLPKSCALCSWPLNGALVAHNLYRDPAVLHGAAAIVCPCKDEWEQELGADSETLVARATRGIEWLESEARSWGTTRAPVTLH